MSADRRLAVVSGGVESENGLAILVADASDFSKVLPYKMPRVGRLVVALQLFNYGILIGNEV